jgi:hypothetical protein
VDRDDDAELAATQRERLRAICTGLPEVEITEGQHWAFLVRGKKFAYHLVDHHGDDRVSLQCKGGPGDNIALVASEPDRFFLPPYMARHGWIGLYLDQGDVDMDEIAELVTDAYLLVAPKRLARQVTDNATGRA